MGPHRTSHTIAAEPLSGQLVGPWERAFWVELPFAVRSKSNFRQSRGGEWGRFARFESDVASTVAPFVPDGWELGSPDEPLSKRPMVVALVAARSTLDASNLSKSVLDALEGILYVTDAQTTGAVNLGERGRSNQWLSVAFAQLRANSPLEDLVAAAAALTAAWYAARSSAST